MLFYSVGDDEQGYLTVCAIRSSFYVLTSVRKEAVFKRNRVEVWSHIVIMLFFDAHLDNVKVFILTLAFEV